MMQYQSSVGCPPSKKMGTTADRPNDRSFEFASHDLVPKEQMIRLRPENGSSYLNPHNLGLLENVLHQLKLSSEDPDADIESTFPFWEQLSREVVAQIKSHTFRDQFFKLVQNDDIHLRILSAHLYLLNE